MKDSEKLMRRDEGQLIQVAGESCRGKVSLRKGQQSSWAGTKGTYNKVAK